MKKQLEESIVNGEIHENKETKEKAKKVERPEDTTSVFREFEEIIRSKKKNIVRLT